MENEWTPPSDGVASGSSFVPPSDAVKKKDLTASGSAQPSLVRSSTTTTIKPTVSSSSKGKADGTYSFPGEENAIYKKENGQWFKSFKGEYKYYPITKGDVQNRLQSLEKNAVSLENYSFEKPEPKMPEVPKELQGDRNTIQYWDKLLAAGKVNKKTYDYQADRIASSDFGQAVTKAAAPKPKQTAAQKAEQELFKKSFDALDVNDPEYLRRKAQSDKIDKSLSLVTPDFVNDNEEDVVPVVERIIKDYPYLQVAMTGFGYDELRIVNTVTGEDAVVNLENWSSSRDKEEANVLRGFLDVQMNSKDYVDQKQKVDKLQVQMQTATPTQRIELSQKMLDEKAKLNELSTGRYNYAKNDKYKAAAIYDKNAKENIKTDFAKLQIQSIDYSEKAKSYNEWNATVNEARKNGTITEEQYNTEYAPKLAAEKNMLIDERNKINEQVIQTKDKSVSIDNIAANQYAIQADRGNVLSGTTYSFLQGAENSLRFLLETGDFQDGEFKGLLTEAAPGSVSDVYTSAEGRNDFEKIIFGLANSGGSALVGAAAGSSFLGLYASSYVNMKDQMSTPEFKDVPEYQKILMSGVYGGTVGVLEKYGLSKWFTKTPAGKGLTNWILKRTVAELGEDASAEAIELSIKKNLGAAITNGLIQVTSAGAVEGSTELAQEAADIVYKDVFNRMADKEYFQNPKTWGEVADRLSEAFKLGFAGGAGMQSITQATQVGLNELNKAQINNITDLIENTELKDTFKLHLKDQIISGEISKDEAKRQIDKINQVEGVLNKIPAKVDKFEAFKLITERDELQKEIAGKDPALVAAQTERVSAINDELKQLSYAVQEQATSEVSVQPGAESSGEMAKGEPEAGPQEVTQEGGQAQEVVQSEEIKTKSELFFNDADILFPSDDIRGGYAVTDENGKQIGRVKMSEVSDNVVKIDEVVSERRGERTGNGSAIMKMVIDNADKNNIVLTLTPNIIGEMKTKGFETADKLRNFYEKFGFVKDKGKATMTRQPSIIKTEPQEVTQEGGQVQEVNELQTVRDRILKIEEAKKKGELLEDSQPGELKSLKQRESELVQEIEKPIMQETTLIEEQVKQPELNIVNNENINDVIERQDTETKQKIAKSAKLAMKAIPKAKIYLHNNTAEYDAAVGEQTDGTEKGSFIASDGSIHINMSEAFPHTLLHEAFHYVILNKGLDAAKLNGWVKGLRSIVKDRKLLNRLDNLLENYSAEEQAEEFISELGSIMGAAKGQLSTNALQKFKTLINKIAKSLGLPTIFTAASTKQDAVDFINTISKQLVTGEEIEVNEPGTSGEIGTFNVPKRKLQKTIRVSEDPRDFIRKFVEDINIREFNGKKFITNMYDYTNAGDTDLGNGFKITMLGGKNYVPLMMELNGKVIGDVSNLAAFNTREQAETFIRNAELGGANLFAPHAGTLDQSWQFQQHTFAELFNLVLDNDILTPKELIGAFNNTIKDSKDNQKQFNQFATKYGEDIKNFDSFESDPKKIIDLLDIKNNYSPKLRKALNNAIASNKKFQQAIGVKNKNEFYNRIMDPLNQGMKGGEIMNIVDFDPTTFQIVETKPNNTDHHPSFGFTLLAKINGIYQPTELVKSVDITDSYTKYNQDGEKTSRKAEEPKFEEKNVSSSAGAIPKTAEFNIPSARKKQLIGKNAYLSKNVKDNLSVAKKMEADKKSPIDIRIATSWEKGVDNKWRYEIEDVKINNKLKDLSKGVIQTKNTSTPIPLSQVISKSNPLLTAYPKLADAIVIVTEVVANNKSVLGAHGLINGEDFILLKAIKDYDLMESTLVHEIQHAIQEIEGFAKGTNVAETYKTKIALDRAVKLAAAEQKALDMNIAFLSKGINTYDKLWAYFVDYIKENLTAEENYDYVINKLGGESNLDLSNDYVIEYLKENFVPGLKDKKSLINMFEAKKLYDQVSGDLGYLSTAGEVESRNVEARRKMSAKERLNTLLSETENIPRSRQIIEGKIARKKQLVYNASPRSIEELGKRSGVVYFATDKREANAYAEGNRGQVREFEIPQESISDEKIVVDKINELGLQPKDEQYTVEESNLYELIDDRFDNSLSQADIKKLFDALKKDGVIAFRYKDGAQVVEGTTESIAVIDTDVVQKSVRKKQLTTDKDAMPGSEAALEALGETEAQREAWKKENKVNQKQKRNPIVEQAAKDYFNEEIDQEEYLDTVAKNQPIKLFKNVPRLPSLKEIVNSLKDNQVATGIIGLTKNLVDGARVACRLDIPAYEWFDTWVVSIHDGVKEGKSIAYGQTAVLKNVDFKTFPGTAMRIATGSQKTTIARMFGDWVNEDPESVHARAEELMKDPAWTQVGMNPFRYSWFYDKSDGMPVVSADEVIQVGALVLAKNVKKVSPNDPMFETKSAKGGKIKFQKGLSKQEAIRKAKEKYVLSVKERGNTPEQGVTSALEDLRKSEWYNEADDVMREEAERELKKFFGEKMKAAPSIKKVMAIKPTKIQVEEMVALKSQIRLEAKAAREAKGDLNAKRKALAAAITGMVRQGKITAVQARSIINKVSRVNLDNPVMVDRLISYAERVFDRADYQETLSKAAKIRKSIKKAMKSKDLQAEVAGMAKKFSSVDPFMVEDIDQYIENAEKVLNAVRPVRETEVPLRQAADIESISEYTTAQVERQEANKKAELLALNKYLVEAGIVTDDMTAKEIQEMIDIIAAEEYEVENADKKLNFLKNRFDFMSGVIEEMIVNNRDIFTDEALDLTQSQKDLMREVLKFDIDKLSVKQAAQVLEAMDNFINNGITSGLKSVVNNYIGNETGNKLAASGLKSRPLKLYWNKVVGKFFGEQFVSLPLLIERMFPGMNKGLKLMSDMGLTNVIRGAAKADREHKMIVKDYVSQEFYKGKGFMKAENVYERGMIAFLSRSLAGTKTEMRNDFLRRVKLVEESINELMDGSETERKMGEAYQKIYDKLKVDSQDLDIIKANAEQMNIDAVNWMTQQWAEKYSELSDISLSVYNAILGSDINYTTDRLKALDGSNIKLDEKLLEKGGAFMGSLDYTDTNKSGVLMETTRPKTLPKGRFVSLDFDVNNFSSLKGAMIDIETAPAIRQVDGFINSDGYKKIVNGDDRKILTNRINKYIIDVKGKNSFNRDTMKSVERLANFFGSLGIGKALGGLDQTVKQTAPVIINTFINAGRFDPLNMEMNKAINRSGMPIANRGLEAVSGVESVDSLIDKKGATAAEIAKGIEKVSQMYMKALLSKPDVWVARSSFISYYNQYLKNNGISTDIDWQTHEWNQDAMDYAQMMVDRQQNISDDKLAGSFMNSSDPWKSVTRKVILPLATFRINQTSRMHNDFIALFGRGTETSLEDKKKAIRSLIALSAELLAFHSVGYFLKTMVYDQIAAYITGEDDEEKKKERSFFGIKMTKKQWSATKFPVKSLVSDIVSPFPLFDDAVVFGFDELMSNFPMISKEDIDKAIQDQNDARALKGQDPMDVEQEANLIKNLKDKNTYKVTFQKESLGRQYGVPGIAFDTYTELADMAQLAYTGEFEDDMGFGPKKKYISKKDQELVKWTLLPMVLYSTGLVPKDAGVVSRKVVATVKKRSISETKFNNTNELKTELGRKPKEWEESLVMNTTKKVPTIVEAIKFAERFGGLTESQGKEYAKLIEVTGDYGYLDLKRIQDGETADQILKK